MNNNLGINLLLNFLITTLLYCKHLSCVYFLRIITATITAKTAKIASAANGILVYFFKCEIKSLYLCYLCYR